RLPIGENIYGRRHRRRRRAPTPLSLVMVERVERHGRAEPCDPALLARDLRRAEHAVVKPRTVAGGEDRRHAGAHPRVELGDPAAELAREAQPRADQMEQLDARGEADSDTHRIAGDLTIAPGDRTPIAIYRGEHDRLDLADTPARRTDRVAGDNRDA